MNQSLNNSSPKRKLNTKFTNTLTSRLSEINEDLITQNNGNQTKSLEKLKDKLERQETKDKKLI